MTSPPVELARLSDADETAKLLRAAYANHAASGLNFSAATVTAEKVRERIALGQVYVARRNGRIVGTYNLRSKADPLGDAAYVNSLAVDPALRGTGLGKVLLEQAEAEAVRGGFARMRLDTAKPLLDLVEWYRRRGYAPVGEVRWPGKTYDSVLLEKVVSDP